MGLFQYIMKILFLGTSSMQPTKERNLSSVLFSHGTENILIDCGEGTQRQMKVAGVKPAKLTKILISHWHGDHVLGLGGLIRNLGANQYNGILEIYGPKGIKEFINCILHSCIYEDRIKINLHEIKEGVIFENKEIYIGAFKLEHSSLCYGFSLVEKDKRKINLEYTKKFGLTKHPILGELQRGKNIVWNGKKINIKDATKLVKGKKISYVSDTGYSNKLKKYAKDSDLIICEATYLDSMHEKAKEYKHLTAKQAAKIAKESNAKKLVLTHFSQRYKDQDECRKEAAGVFKNVVCAKDFMEFEV